MKIAASALQLSSTHTEVEYTSQQESLTLWSRGRNRDASPRQRASGQRNGLEARQLARDATRVTLSGVAKQQAAEAAGTGNTVAASSDQLVAEQTTELKDLNLRILKTLFARLSSRQAGGEAAALRQRTAAAASTGTAIPQAGDQGAGNSQGAQDIGVLYQRHEVRHEAESTSFNAQGLVRTTDGQEIAINIELSMSRSFTAASDTTLQVGEVAFKDPLVFNFQGTAAQLTQQTFSFDIDADGTDDQIAFVQPGSGFLALDSDGNGRIDNGGELFGARTGDGFDELAAYDDDHNGWIDENDAVFSRLQIWSKNETGGDQLASLSGQGVGAISLGRVATQFSVKDSSNTLQGQVRTTGLFLFEEGGAGTVQQLDLVA